MDQMNGIEANAQQVLALARKEADRFNHNFVGTEHLLLGLIKLGQGVAVNVLQKMGLDLETVRGAVEKQVGTGQETKTQGSIPYTPRVKKVLALAGKEAKALNHSYVGTEHILLGLIREGEGVAAAVLQQLAVDLDDIQQKKSSSASSESSQAIVRSATQSVWYHSFGTGLTATCGAPVSPPPVSLTSRLKLSTG